MLSHCLGLVFLRTVIRATLMLPYCPALLFFSLLLIVIYCGQKMMMCKCVEVNRFELLVESWSSVVREGTVVIYLSCHRSSSMLLIISVYISLFSLLLLHITWHFLLTTGTVYWAIWRYLVVNVQSQAMPAFTLFKRPYGTLRMGCHVTSL